jgi:hypothetical protein
MRCARHSDSTDFSTRLRSSQWRRSRVKTIKVQKVERVIHQPIVAAALEIVLQCTEVWAAVLIRANDLAVQDELGARKARHARDDRREAIRPVKSTAGIKPHAAVVYVSLHPIAIQLEFMDQNNAVSGPGASPQYCGGGLKCSMRALQSYQFQSRAPRALRDHNRARRLPVPVIHQSGRQTNWFKCGIQIFFESRDLILSPKRSEPPKDLLHHEFLGTLAAVR